MTTPEWLRSSIYGALMGAAIVSIAGFTWGGWVTGGTARENAMAMSHDDVVAALVPVCLDMAQTDPQRESKLATIRAATTYNRRVALMEAGWATVPGAKSANRDIAQACLTALDVDALPERPEAMVDDG